MKYDGILPNLFAEDKGVVVEGVYMNDGRFIANKVLAKHDENYMPPEVIETLKKSGKWQDLMAQGHGEVAGGTAGVAEQPG